MNNFELIAQAFRTSPFQALASILLVALPIAAWIILFLRQNRAEKKAVIITFLAGVGSAVLMFFYQYFWEKQLDFGFFELIPVNFQQNIGAWTQNKLFSVFLVAMSIGLIEEYLKHWVVKKADQSYFRSVNDVIQMSIFAALGFAFAENVIYLFRELTQSGLSGKFFSLFLLRSVFVVFVHVLCSGIYGYYYGVGHYARPLLETDPEEGRKNWIPEFLYRLIHWKKERVFRDEMIALGLLVSMLVHGLFDFFMSANWTLGGLLGIPALQKIGLHVIILPLYLIGGFTYIFHLFAKKRHYEEFGQVKTETIYVEHDLKKNLKSMQNMEDSITENLKAKQKKEAVQEFTKNIGRMRDLEESVKKSYQKKQKAESVKDFGKNLERMKKLEDAVKEKYGKKEDDPKQTLEKNLKMMGDLEKALEKKYRKQ